MMSIYLITFQIVGEDAGDRLQQLVYAIKGFGMWARITNTSWCIKSEHKTTTEIRTLLIGKCPLQSEDRLMIINISNAPWASYNVSNRVADWLKGD